MKNKIYEHVFRNLMEGAYVLNGPNRVKWGNAQGKKRDSIANENLSLFEDLTQQERDTLWKEAWNQAATDYYELVVKSPLYGALS